jgi:hypothetical protein
MRKQLKPGTEWAPSGEERRADEFSGAERESRSCRLGDLLRERAMVWMNDENRFVHIGNQMYHLT